MLAVAALAAAIPVASLPCCVAQTRAESSVEKPVSVRADALLKQMTLDEKLQFILKLTIQKAVDVGRTSPSQSA